MTSLRQRLAIGFTVFALALGSATNISGQQNQLVAISYEQLTISSTATGLSASTIKPSGNFNPAAYCKGRLKTADISYRYDGGTPTVTDGNIMHVDEAIEISGVTNVARFKAIRTGTTDAALPLTCFEGVPAREIN